MFAHTNQSRKFAILTLVLFSACANDGKLSTVVNMGSGELEGFYADENKDVLVYRGIPYAEPPIGPLRWKPPAQKGKWEGVRDAKSFGSACWQPIRPETSVYSRGEMEVSEDCLYLNVWTRADRQPEGRPVMVWLHGGANRAGHGHSLIFDGTALARKGVVLVTVNYRLGPFGFFAHPALTAESEHTSSGNYGLLDQVAALEWVRDNIGAFGGDRNQVTLFGQSSGAVNACLLMTSPLAKGLFHRVIGQSGGCLKHSRHLLAPGGPRGDDPSAHDDGLAVAKELGIEGEDAVTASKLRDVEPQALSEALVTAGVRLPPIIDGWVIPKSPRAIFEAGECSDVPVIVGSMADEIKGTAPQMPALPIDKFESEIRQLFGQHAEEVLAEYAALTEESTQEAMWAIRTDSDLTWGARAWTRLVEHNGNDAFLYLFSHPPPVFRLYIAARPAIEVPEGLRGRGAYHSGDLAYVFNNVGLVGLGWQEWDYKLSDMMSQYWVNFARTGDPNGENLPPWPRYRGTTDELLEFGETVKTTKHPRTRKLDIFDAVFRSSVRTR